MTQTQLYNTNFCLICQSYQKFFYITLIPTKRHQSLFAGKYTRNDQSKKPQAFFKTSLTSYYPCHYKTCIA